MTGRYFANFIEEHSPRLFQMADKGEENLFVQDNCPCQNSAFTKAAMDSLQCTKLALEEC